MQIAHAFTHCVCAVGCTKEEETKREKKDETVTVTLAALLRVIKYANINHVKGNDRLKVIVRTK